MAKHWKRTAALLATAVLSASAVVGVTACGGDTEKEIPNADLKQGTYRTYTTVLPSNWNELTYEDNNDTQILNYLVSPFFEYDYEFDESKGGKFREDGTINAEAIVPGSFSVKYSAATALEDVTSTVDAKWGYTDKQKEEGGYAWKITLREDIKWDDGTPIDATDFVYTMQEQLNPDFFNMRANTYYNNTPIKNARAYLYHTTAETYETPGSQGFESVQAALDSDQTLYIDVYETWGMQGAQKVTSFTPETGDYVVDEEAETCPQWLAVDDEQLWLDPAFFDEEDADPADYIVSGADIFSAMWEGGYAGYMEVGAPYEAWLAVKVANTHMDVDWEDVGIYAPSKYEIVVCLEAPIMCLKEDGSLSYLAAYNFSSLPLVKKSLYESCKKEPQTGSTLWTTNYNSSLDTSASWGPYKLTSFQSGKSYELSRNDNWYGYNLEDNKNQYNVTKINCEVIADVNTQWMSFLSGKIDDIGLDVTHKNDYRNSKYTLYAPGTGTFGIQLYSGLDVLKTNGHNAGVLAIKDFRQAISLYLDRDEYNQTCFTSHRTCYGLLGPSYYYDVENGGVYRDTKQAKETLLSVYGFTKNADGTWTDGKNTYGDYEDAYEAMNGMNRTLAKELLKNAWDELTSRADYYGYDASKNISITYGTSADNENTRRSYDYFVKFFADLTKDTPFEGKVELVFDASAGADWADAFKDGEVEFAAGTGFSGGAFDPEGFLQCYVDPEAGLMYSENFWDTDAENFTYTMPAASVYGDYEGAGQSLTMSVLNWYCCLNGVATTYKDGGYRITQTFNWGAGAIPEGARMELLAALEKLVLEKYFTVITTSEYSATVNGAKFSNITDEYNIFMGFGGLRYNIVNYTDAEWDAYVASQNNDLTNEYKKEA